MVKRSKNLLTYDKILDLYATDLDAGRIFLYKVIPTLAQKSPYHRYVSANHTADDIHWEMFMFLDSILTSNRTRQSKFYYLWNVFHRMHDSLNKTLKLYKEVYDESLLTSETYDIKDVDWMLEYLLDLHWVLNSAEKKVLFIGRESRYNSTYYTNGDRITTELERFNKNMNPNTSSYWRL